MKLAIISRGVSGSGKSTFSRKLAEAAKNRGLQVAVHCTDDLFMVGDEYRFNPAHLGTNHAKNLVNFENSLKENINIVVNDNTNTSPWEWKKYADAARAADYALVELFFEPGDIDDHDKRNTHGVPREILEGQKRKLLSNADSEGFDIKLKINQQDYFTFSERLNFAVSHLIENN